MAAEKSKILVIGATGYIGKYVVRASVQSDHPTFALVRNSAPSDPAKAQILKSFTDIGVTLVKGDLYDHESLVKAIKAVDVVISTVGAEQLADQVRIVAAIKEAGNIKRFLPSEFGLDVDREHSVEPAKSMFVAKARVRRAVEAQGIPYTYVCSNCFLNCTLPNLGQIVTSGSPTNKVAMFHDGNTKAIFVLEDDIGTYTIKAADDPRTLNKILYMRPATNILSHNEIISLREKKTGKTFERVYVPEDEVLRQIKEAPTPMNVMLAIGHSVFVKGDQTNFEIEPSVGVEASQLYPEVKYTTVDECLDRLL